jgi:hypothetical protein
MQMNTRPEFGQKIRPIFIIGAPRSGTSITTWALGQHPNIQTMPETTWIATLAVGGYLSHGYGSARGRYSHLSNVDYELEAFLRRLGEAAHAISLDCYEKRCQRLYGDYRNSGDPAIPTAENEGEFRVRRNVHDPKQRWIDGTPYNSHFIWALSQMFPDAMFIHNLRRPHEVATSLEGFDKLGMEPQALTDGLDTWRHHTEGAWLAERALGADKVFRLYFDRIASDAEALLRELCEFLGEEYCPDCLLPLAQRINSSHVDDRHKENLRLLSEMPEYHAAEALYRDILDTPASTSPDAEAYEALRSRFEEHCWHCSLI